MLRSAAKNHGFVTVVTDVGGLRAAPRRARAQRRRHLARLPPGGGAHRLRPHGRLRRGGLGLDGRGARGGARRGGAASPGTLAQPLRYGENPHQGAAFYRDGSGRPGVATARQLQGKALSYNNINDTDAAFELVAEFAPADGPACAIIKHANPCGVARGATPRRGLPRRLRLRPHLGLRRHRGAERPLDAETAAAIAEIFTEVVIAPEVDAAAAAVFAAKKNLRLLVTGGLPDPRAPGLAWRQVAGGFLVQGRDNGRLDPAEPAGRHPPRADARRSSPTCASPGRWPST